MRSPCLLIPLFLLLIAGGVRAQSSGVPPPSPPDATPITPGSPQAPGFTFHAGTRIVLTDVMVTDRSGNPVRGLGRSVFQIFDNGRSQPIASFEEHSGAATDGDGDADLAAAPHSFNNRFLLHPPAISNILLFDTTTINIFDQMYLNQQMNHFVEALPPGERAAVYLRADEFAVMLQGFTSDHGLLLAAIHKAIPHFPFPGARYTSDIGTLEQMIDYLKQLPGRKNIIWFSGGSNLELSPDGGALPPAVNMRPVYDELEASRIAVFPVDARGLTISSNTSMMFQHLLMDQVAQATGGQAFYNTNGLRESAARVMDAGSSFYTLTYVPNGLQRDNKWHKVTVQIDGNPYTLSYRRGYFDDGRNVLPAPQARRTLLRADNQITTLPENRESPIIFEAAVLPTPPVSAGQIASPARDLSTREPRKGETSYTISYTLPATAFVQKTGNGKSQVEVGTGVMALNRTGRPVANMTRSVTVTIDEELFRTHPNGVLRFDQQINLPKGDNFLYIGVWDTMTRRLGTLQVPLHVGR